MVTLYYLVGVPGSGKSTLAEQIKKLEEDQTEIYSSDTIRQIFLGDVNDQDHNKFVFKKMFDMTVGSLCVNTNAIYDATNINRQKRLEFLEDLNKQYPLNDIKKICIYVDTPVEECLKRNEKRKRKVPEGVIWRMYDNIQAPLKAEGWDEIITIKTM